MSSMREAWTDERLDDLNHRLDEGFCRIDGDLRALRIETKTELTSLRGEMNERFERVDTDLKGFRSDMNTRFERADDRVNDRFDRIDDRFGRIDDRFEALQRTMVHAAVGMSAAFIAGFAALIGLFAT